MESKSLAVIPAGDNHPFHITPMGLEACRKNVSFETWEAFGHRLRQVEAAIQWNLGDWLLWGEAHYGEEFSQALDHTHWNPLTIMNYTRVCHTFPIARRIFPLSFSHYQCVMGLPPKKQDELLKQAAHDTWNRAKLRDQVRQAKGRIARDHMDLYWLHSEVHKRARLVEQLMILKVNEYIKSFELRGEAKRD